MELWLPLATSLFFFGLCLPALRGAAAAREFTKFALFEGFADYEKFEWGRMWVYDNRLRENQEHPLVFIHSIGSSIYSWRYQIESLGRQRRIIALDLYGFGKSDKNPNALYNLDAHTHRILEVLDRKELKRCVLVGCSLGGALALWLAQKLPKRFPKVVVIAPAASPQLVPFMQLRHDLLTPLAQRIISRQVVRIALRGGTAYRQRLTDDVVDSYWEPFTDPAAIGCFLKSVSTIKDDRIFKSLSSITSPVLVLWGAADTVVPRFTIQQILGEISHKKFIEHPTGGHHLMEDEGDWVNEKIENFLSSEEK